MFMYKYNDITYKVLTSYDLADLCVCHISNEITLNGLPGGPEPPSCLCDTATFLYEGSGGIQNPQ